ncbi:MAG TPA: hypothetical protein VJN96_17135 [Vicinamibacterales bacterium]|nr:hypothetical protein [Vicinamibacterales bacterium]
MPDTTSYVLPTYLGYLTLSTAVTVWVARTLYRSGRTFLVDAFHGQEALADSVNHLLVVGFYLINLGWIAMTLETRRDVSTIRSAVELLSDKVGTVLFLLGIMHFFNLYLFNYYRRRALDRLPTAPPPIPPTAFFKAQESAR